MHTAWTAQQAEDHVLDIESICKSKIHKIARKGRKMTNGRNWSNEQSLLSAVQRTQTQYHFSAQSENGQDRYPLPSEITSSCQAFQFVSSVVSLQECPRGMLFLKDYPLLAWLASSWRRVGFRLAGTMRIPTDLWLSGFGHGFVGIHCYDTKIEWLNCLE